VALVVLLAALGSVVAGVVPIILAVLSIVVALGAAGLVALGMDLSAFAVNITMMGLAVGRPRVSTLPDGVESKEAFVVLEREFSGWLDHRCRSWCTGS